MRSSKGMMRENRHFMAFLLGRPGRIVLKAGGFPAARQF
jgi:hypothetical protein